VLLSDFNYTLPEALIAQTPLTNRGGSRMLVVDRTAGCWKDLHFQDLSKHLKSGDRLIFNNTRVIPARLFGTKTSGSTDASQDQLRGRVEILLLKQVKQSPVCWEALVRPSCRIRKGERFVLPEDVEAVILEEGSDSSRIVQFSSDATDFTAWLDRVGHIPLPPYIKRSDTLVDRNRYQTVFAAHPGSVAAPTAGLHFTSDTLTKVDSIDVRRVEVTLHVELGTFQPIRTEII
jgi:S-adenosylmethionine:tRNA ribosyltransferase-isomerase